ncbi:uncharacterized protein LOC135388105 [Ornithodoros turicata]|uniref:uncharacterized protein LOC135388105 n=1 Tax=Ornithodoros turicata TaxID=34597 RepID=UPI003139FF41
MADVGDSSLVVEMISSARGKLKAKRGKWTYTMDKRVNDRFHWRCDLRPCRGRLTTDLYEGRHMFYRAKPHCQETHRKYRPQGMVLPLKVTPLEPVEDQDATENGTQHDDSPTPLKERARIGDYVYVLEHVRGKLHFWRCERRSCTGRCRTLDGIMVAGPSEHAHDPASNSGKPSETGQDSPAVPAIAWQSSQTPEYIALEPNIVIEDGQEDSEGDVVQPEVPTAPTQPMEHISQQSPALPPPPPLQIGGKTANKSGTRYAFVTPATSNRVSTPSDLSGLKINAVLGNADMMGTPQLSIKSESDQSSFWENGISEDGLSSDWSQLKRHKRNRLDILELSGLPRTDSLDTRERELRLDVLLQTRRLLEAETELLVQQRKNEELRYQILRRTYKDTLGT